MCVKLGKCETSFVITRIPCDKQGRKEGFCEESLGQVCCGDTIEFFRALGELAKVEGDPFFYSIHSLKIQQEQPDGGGSEAISFFDPQNGAVSALFAATVLGLYQTCHRRGCEEIVATPPKEVETELCARPEA